MIDVLVHACQNTEASLGRLWTTLKYEETVQHINPYSKGTGHRQSKQHNFHLHPEHADAAVDRGFLSEEASASSCRLFFRHPATLADERTISRRTPLPRMARRNHATLPGVEDASICQFRRMSR